ncbi:MAG TPA: OFA family MFS transporter [Syntrophorhabdales bacterium]|nr:OFA family MFS transporter [Syntrophorhabdales bacterium]
MGNGSGVNGKRGFMNSPWVMLTAGVLGMVMISSLQYAWSLFVPDILKANPKFSKVEIQTAFATFVACMTFAGPLSGYLIDKFGTKIFFSLAAILVAVGWGGIGFQDKVLPMCIFYGFAGIGASFIYTGGIAASLKWFPKKKGTASGIMACGFGSGAALFGWLITILVANYGYKTAFLWTGIGFAVALLLVAQVLRFPEAAGSTAKAADSAKPKQAETKSYSPVEMFQTGQFYLIYGMFVLMAIGYMFLTPNIKLMANDYKVPAAIFTITFTAFTAANGIGRIVWGIISDKIGRENAMCIDFVACGLLYVLIPFVAWSPYMFLIVVTVAFFCTGPMFAFFPPITADRYGEKFLSTNYGVMYTAKGVGGLIGPTFITALALYYAKMQGFQIGWTVACSVIGAASVASGLGALILKKIAKPAGVEPVRPATA